MIPTVSIAQTLTVTRTVYLEHGNVVHPNSIVRTRDEGLIVAGSIELPNHPRDAWATKTDSQGRVVWRYSTPLREKINVYDGPEFSSVAVMPDESVFLCGRMPFKAGTGESSPGLLTHLDKTGKLLSEQLLYPHGKNVISLTGLTSCLQAGDGLIVVGKTSTFVKNSSSQTNGLPPYVQTQYYLASLLDSRGQTQWQQLLPLSDKREGSDYMSPVQLMADGSFVFTAVRNTLGTRVMRISAKGDVAASRMLDEDFILLRSTLNDEHLRLLSTQTESLTMLTLDNNLKETARLTGAHTIGEADMAYLLPDDSLIVFGAKHDRNGLSYMAWAMSADSHLKHSNFVLLGAKGESGWSKAGVPLSQSGEFVSVRSAITPSHLGIHATDEQLSKIRLGVALDFIQLK